MLVFDEYNKFEVIESVLTFKVKYSGKVIEFDESTFYLKNSRDWFPELALFLVDHEQDNRFKIVKWMVGCYSIRMNNMGFTIEQFKAITLLRKFNIEYLEDYGHLPMLQYVSTHLSRKIGVENGLSKLFTLFLGADINRIYYYAGLPKVMQSCRKFHDSNDRCICSC